MIYVSREAGRPHPAVSLIDRSLGRNACGRLGDSRETDLPIHAMREAPFPAVFIRAPLIAGTGPDVQVLARLADGRPVAAQSGRVLVTSFHPELTGDLRIHRYFLEQCAAAGAPAAAEPRRKTA